MRIASLVVAVVVGVGGGAGSAIAQSIGPNQQPTPPLVPAAAAAGDAPQARIQRKTIEPDPTGAMREVVTVVIPLNIVGIFDADFLNPRNPPDILAPTVDDAKLVSALASDARPHVSSRPETAERNAVLTEIDALARDGRSYRQAVSDASKRGARPGLGGALDAIRAEYASRVRVSFDNRASNRTFVLTSTVAMPLKMQEKLAASDTVAYAVEQAAWEAATGAKLDSCRSGETPQCGMTITIQAHTAPAVPANVFVEFDARDDMVRPKPTGGRVPPIEFKVTFFDELSDPAQPRGYFSVVRLSNLGESPDKSAWSIVAQVGASEEPDTGDSSTTYTLANAYPGRYKSHVPGVGRLNIKQNLGNRADVDIDLSYKRGDFGEKDQSAKLGASKFRVNIYALNGVTLSFGKFDFAAPTSAIAAKESGEGFRFAYRNVAVSHIVHRESADGTANSDNRDNKSVVLEVNNISGLNWRVARSVNFYAAYGRESLTSAPTATPVVLAHAYSTIGTELFWDTGTFPLQGSVAYYHSASDAIQQSGYKDASGDVEYLTASYTVFTGGVKDGKKEVGRSVTGQLGTGSPRRGGADIAYVGETQAFAPDTLLLATFVGKISAAENVGLGLANKIYWSGTYSEQLFSPLQWVAALIRVPETDIASRASIFQYHHYDLRQPVNNATEAAHEFDATFQIETPKGVKSSIVLSALRTGSALRSLLGERWVRSLAANVSVKL